MTGGPGLGEPGVVALTCGAVVGIVGAVHNQAHTSGNSNSSGAGQCHIAAPCAGTVTEWSPLAFGVTVVRSAVPASLPVVPKL